MAEKTVRPKARSSFTQVQVDLSISGLSPLSWGKAFNEGLAENETHDDFEARIWPERFHYTTTDQATIPQMAVKLAIETAAKHSGKKTEGKATWTKHFLKGVLAVDGGDLFDGSGNPIMRDDLKNETLFVPSNGQKGGGTRVYRTFPIIHPPWRATFTLFVVDSKITPAIFAEMAQIAGSLIGVGRFRPDSGGYYGRFSVDEVVWGGTPVALE